MDSAVTEKQLPPLLGSAFPPGGFDAAYMPLLVKLQRTLDEEVAPRAVENDRKGRYPTESIAALKRSGILATMVPKDLGGDQVPHRVSLEAQVRMAAADSAVAQIYKIHDELVREILVYAPPSFRPRLARVVLEENAIIGLAVAEPGKTVHDPMKTTATQADGGFILNGRKIYTTGAAEADYIAVWAFNPDAPGVAENALMGMQLNLVPKGAPGVTIHRDWDAMGQRATDSGTITFDNVRTDPELKASIPGKAPLVHASLRYQAGFAADLVGLGIGALRAAVPFITAQSRPWPSAGVENAADDPNVRRLAGELTADLVAAYVTTLATGDLLDAFERGEIDRTTLAIPIYAAKSVAARASLKVTAEIFTLMGARSVARASAFDRFWRDARTLALHDPVEWKHSEIGRHVCSGWEPPPGLYQ